MKLERFNGKKFEALSDESMAFVVGGYYDRSPAGPGYSNDYKTYDSNGTATNHYPDNPATGNDWSAAMMKKFCGDLLVGQPADGEYVPEPLPGDALYPEFLLKVDVIANP